MKKLFFAAAIAIVAVGGALSSQASITAYPLGQTSPITCDAGSTLCTDLQPLYKVATPQNVNTQYTDDELGFTRLVD